MNRDHLKAFLWLRRRIVVNRNRRAGKASLVIQTIFAVLLAAGAILGFFVGIGFGALAVPRLSAENVMLVWDGVAAAFLLFWTIELMVELQRSELLSLDKFLHLPVSLSGVFLINYLGSLSSAGFLVFIPAMIGLSIGLVVSKGLIMLLMFPLVAAFALAVTALTHQFRGWLASLMTNQRRRRTIMVSATFVFIAIVQIPNLLNFTGVLRRFESARGAEIREQIRDLNRALGEKEITQEQRDSQVRRLRSEERSEDWKRVQNTARVANLYFPLGWLPYGAGAAIEGRPAPALLGTLGLALIGAASLRRSYSTTRRLYTGQFGSKRRKKGAAKTAGTEAVLKPGQYSAAFVERRLPFVSEHASAVASACLRSLLRAPEAKMMMLTPLLMLVIFGGMTIARSNNPPALLRPLLAAAGVTFMLFMMAGLIGNAFGSDRGAFRVFVLASAPRRDILLGKNLSLAPFGVGFAMLSVMVLQVAYPMRVDHYLASLLQTIPMYLLFSLAGNLLSILAPMPIAPGSMKPVKPKGITILIHFAAVFVFPLAMAPTLVPLGVESLLVLTGRLAWFPAYLVLTLAEIGGVCYLYGTLLDYQGRFLQQREQRILEIVTSKLE